MGSLVDFWLTRKTPLSSSRTTLWLDWRLTLKYTSAWVKQRTAKNGKKTWYGYLKYQDDNGKYRQTSKAFDRKKVKGERQAERALEEWRQEMEATSSVVSSKTYTTTYVLNHLDNLALEEDQRTIRNKKLSVNKHFGRFDKVPLGNLTTNEVQDWVKCLNGDGYKPGAIGYIFGILRGACIHAVEVGDLPRNPCKGVKLPKAPTPKPNGLEPEDMMNLLDTLDAEGPTRLSTAAYIALLAGLRIGEVCALTWGDYDGETLSVDKSIAYDTNEGNREKSPKTEAGEREVPVPPRLAEMLERRKQYQLEQIESNGIDADLESIRIVGEVDGSTAGPVSLGHQWSKFAKSHAIIGAAGRQCTFHALRDSYGTSLMGAGVDVKTAAVLMGHGDGGVTLLKHYATSTRAARRAAAAKLTKALEGNND